MSSPNMSDTTLLVSVEDLISMAMGPPDKNIVNFKLVQTILHILARQMRLLQTQVEIKIPEPTPVRQKKRKKKMSLDSSPESSPRRHQYEEQTKGVTSKAPKEAKERPKKEEKIEKPERTDKKEKDKENLDKMSAKEREKAEREAQREKQKLEKMDKKEREKYEKEKERAAKEAQKEKEKLEKMDKKEREKYEKEKQKAEKEAQKEKEKMEKMDRKEREKYEKEKEKAEREAQKEKEKLEKMDKKEKEKYEKEKEKSEREAQKERENIEKMDKKEREKYEKEKEKAEREAQKELEKAEKEARKEKEKLEKMDKKERERYEKEKEKAEREAQKEKEKLEKMDRKERERYEKEKEKLEKMSAKEREKAEKEAQKEKEKLATMSKQEKEKYLKEKEEREALEEKTSSLSVTETVRGKEKVLVVEKGPTTRESRTRLGSIEVVTISQFELLQAVVQDLSQKAGPLPMPSLPENKQLISQLVKGSASLTDTMEAMQVSARMQAAEQAIARMADLLQQMAAAGALPEEFAGKLDDVTTDLQAVAEQVATMSREGGGIVPAGGATGGGGVAGRPAGPPRSGTPRPAARGTHSAALSNASSVHDTPVTHPELEDAVARLRDSLNNNLTTMTGKAAAAAENAAAVAKGVSDKMEVAMKLSSQISALNSIVEDYATQLNGFDAGLTTQMQNFQEQMAQMRNDLKGGLVQLEAANNNAESAALTELMERYEGLVQELEHTTHEHHGLSAFQRQLSDDLAFLSQNVEMLREQKADRDEMLDGLRDKADNSRLAGLLTETAFDATRAELEKRLDACYDKFRKQESAWMRAIKDLYGVSEQKADMMPLLAMREDTQRHLQDLTEWMEMLARILGEPKAALLTRQLSSGGACGACAAPALMEAVERAAGRPPALPALRPAPLGEDQPCAPNHPMQPVPDERSHVCQRWVGGSHTLVSGAARGPAGPRLTAGLPTRRYAGYGADGRLYKLEDELEPCVECNLLSTDKEGDPDKPAEEVQETGAGDTGVTSIKNIE